MVYHFTIDMVPLMYPGGSSCDSTDGCRLRTPPIGASKTHCAMMCIAGALQRYRHGDLDFCCRITDVPTSKYQETPGRRSSTVSPQPARRQRSTFNTMRQSRMAVDATRCRKAKKFMVTRTSILPPATYEEMVGGRPKIQFANAIVREASNQNTIGAENTPALAECLLVCGRTQ